MTGERPRLALGGLILVVMALSAAYSGGFLGLRERFPPPASRTQSSPFGAPIEQRAAAQPAADRRSQPYWRPLRAFTGSGSQTTPTFAVDRRALQWRVAWGCERGSLRVQPERGSGEPYGHRLADTDGCPERGQGLSVAPGSFALGVAADGPWTARVEQQLDVPLIEPPTPEMTSERTRLLARGNFYDVDENGLGRIEVYREPSGATSLRLEGFYVTPNVDLEIRLSELERPRSTGEVAQAPFDDVVFLRATSGSMNYRLPPGTLHSRVRSVVIWCEITRNAYAAASLSG